MCKNFSGWHIASDGIIRMVHFAVSAKPRINLQIINPGIISMLAVWAVSVGWTQNPPYCQYKRVESADCILQYHIHLNYTANLHRQQCMWPIQTAASFPSEHVQATRGGVKPGNETNGQLLDINSSPHTSGYGWSAACRHANRTHPLVLLSCINKMKCLPQ